MADADAARPEWALPTSFRPLPPAPDLPPDKKWSLLLFYQYCEPCWSDADHKRALSKVISLGQQFGITGRGRCAAEGLNCTLTAEAASIRLFCEGLREWKPQLFNATDFKITDGLQTHEKFKALTIRKTDELVGYGLANDLAPRLETSAAKHLDAVEYHAALQRTDAVVIDVRNAYESEIGRFQPPIGGATLIDPLIRNSHEFPKWLALPETQSKLQGKTVLMYCTGGIRCERASALLDAMQKQPAVDAAAAEEPPPGIKEILMVRGGIERYIRTFPQGGYWKGANYLFDRRFEQRPDDAQNSKPLGQCAACGVDEDQYRGQYKCATGDCRVPVIVCKPCRDKDAAKPFEKEAFRLKLKCRLCRTGVAGSAAAPLPAVTQRLKLAPGSRATEVAGGKKGKKRELDKESDVVFVGNLPFTADRTELLKALKLDDAKVSWLLDRTHKLFYGSALVQCSSLAAAKHLVKGFKAQKVGGRTLRIGFGPAIDLSGAVQTARPPPGGATGSAAAAHSR